MGLRPEYTPGSRGDRRAPRSARAAPRRRVSRDVDKRPTADGGSSPGRVSLHPTHRPANETSDSPTPRQRRGCQWRFGDIGCKRRGRQQHFGRCRRRSGTQLANYRCGECQAWSERGFAGRWPRTGDRSRSGRRLLLHPRRRTGRRRRPCFVPAGTWPSDRRSRDAMTGYCHRHAACDDRADGRTDRARTRRPAAWRLPE